VGLGAVTAIGLKGTLRHGTDSWVRSDLRRLDLECIVDFLPA